MIVVAQQQSYYFNCLILLHSERFTAVLFHVEYFVKYIYVREEYEFNRKNVQWQENLST